MRAATEGHPPPVIPEGNLVEVLGREVRKGLPGELIVESSPSRQMRPPCKTSEEMSDEAADAAALTYSLTYLRTKSLSQSASWRESISVIARLTFKKGSLAKAFHVRPILFSFSYLGNILQHFNFRGTYGGLVLDTTRTIVCEPGEPTELRNFIRFSSTLKRQHFPRRRPGCAIFQHMATKLNRTNKVERAPILEQRVSKYWLTNCGPRSEHISRGAPNLSTQHSITKWATLFTVSPSSLS